MTQKKYLYPALIILLAIAAFFILPPDKNRLYPQFSSVQIYDRNGHLLRECLSRDYKTSLWVDLDRISPYVIMATIQREDKRFFSHHGVDPLASFRAIYYNLKNRRILFGGSTVTMQVAKMALGFKKRDILTKLIETIYALKLELHLSKDKILEIYLNRAPYGNQVYGVESASRLYFQKPASQLSLGESCIIAIIPKSPARLNPYINPGLVLKEKERLLRLLLGRNSIDRLGFSCAMRESLNVVPKGLCFEAPHFVDYILNKMEGLNHSRIWTTLDLDLQKKIEKHLFTTLRSLKGYNINQGAVVVMDTATGEILSMVGSKDYFDAEEGQVNATLALRQPGSAIKPFLYLLAISDGIPASYILDDNPMEFRLSDGTLFAPRNYGNSYHGLVRLREALACSLNVPSVYLLDKLGVQRFYDLLKGLGFKRLDKEAEFYGLSLGLGAGEVQLLELVNAYRAIAQNGVWEEEKVFLNPSLRREKQRPIFTKEVSYIITDILSDDPSRVKSFGEDSPLNLPFPCASKTGTSKDFRDNWCIGFTRRYVVGVWVGNFDGSPMKGVSGISGAAPLFRDIMIELQRDDYPMPFEEPSSLAHLKICEEEGKIAGQGCPKMIEEIFIKGSEPKGYCRHHIDTLNTSFRIINPSDGNIFKIDKQVSYSSQGINFKVKADKSIDEVIFELNGRVIAKESFPFEYLWSPHSGRYKLKAIGLSNSNKETDYVSFRVF